MKFGHYGMMVLVLKSINQTPLFVPFRIRNKIINEDKKKRDIIYLPNQYDVLSSHMSEKQIFDGINKRIGQVFFSKAKGEFNVTNSLKAFKKNQVMIRSQFLQQWYKKNG